MHTWKSASCEGFPANGELVFSNKLPPPPPLLWIIFDVETTGLSKFHDDIIQLATSLWLELPGATPVCLERDCSFVHSSKVLTSYIISLTNIRPSDLSSAAPFKDIFDKVMASIERIVQVHPDLYCLWVAHNGMRFDVPFIVRHIWENAPHHFERLDSGRHWVVDTYLISLKTDWGTTTPVKNHKQITLYERLCGKIPSISHRADADVRVLEDVFWSPTIQDGRLKCVVPFLFCRTDMRPVGPLQASGAKIDVAWTDQQKTILDERLDRHLCVIAGAGCAKTTTILGRILRLVSLGVSPSQIILTTFTKDAANDMIRRLERWVGQSFPIFVGTIDSIALRFLRKLQPELLEECVDVGEYKYAFLKFLKKRHCPMRKFLVSSIRYIFVDEYQDLNQCYFDIVKQFAQEGAFITAVGDDAQNIYSWNGSNIKYILEFKDHFQPSQIHYLTHNFRSTPEVVSLANQCILRNTNQYPKEIIATRESISFVPFVAHFFNWEAEAEFIVQRIRYLRERGWEYSSIVIMSRNCTNHGPLYFIESVLTREKIPNILLERHGVSRNKIVSGKVCLCTIHKSKGLEWNCVFVVGNTDTFFPGNALSLVKLEEERRLFYVAITRTMNYLYLTYCTQKKSSKYSNTCMTRFISEVPRRLFRWHNVHPTHFLADPQEERVRTSIYSVDSIVDRMSTESTYSVRKSHLFYNLTWESESLHKGFCVPPWISEYHIYEDFEAWLKVMIIRQMGGKTTRVADRVIGRLVVSKQVYHLYQNRKTILARHINSLRSLPVKGGEITSSARSAVSERLLELEPDLKGATDLDHLAQLALLIIDRANYLDFASCNQVYVCTRSALPVDVWQEMENSYRKYQDASLSWRELLSDGFRVSWSSSIERGRTRFLYRKWKSEWIGSARPMLDACEKFACLIPQERELEAIREFAGFQCEIPVYVPSDGGTLIDYDFSEEGNISVHLALKLLIKTCLFRKKGDAVSKLILYNPYKGIVRRASIETWDSHDSFLELLMENVNVSTPPSVDWFPDEPIQDIISISAMDWTEIQVSEQQKMEAFVGQLNTKIDVKLREEKNECFFGISS
jgi:hypothetical protein